MARRIPPHLSPSARAKLRQLTEWQELNINSVRELKDAAQDYKRLERAVHQQRQRLANSRQPKKSQIAPPNNSGVRAVYKDETMQDVRRERRGAYDKLIDMRGPGASTLNKYADAIREAKFRRMKPGRTNYGRTPLPLKKLHEMKLKDMQAQKKPKLP